MYFINDIKDIAAAEGMGFYHGPKDFQNLKDQDTDNVYPACYLHFPVRGSNTRKLQGFGETSYFIELLFGDKSDLSWTMEQHTAVIQAMEARAHTFMNKLLRSGKFRDVRDYHIYECINLFDINLTGIIAEVTVTPFDRRANC
ncbi:hypothetical protein DJ568_15475 [Mucilaginibacter hurinus]|uniref:Uncharacterized protein n=1 Tax=Mucilaginibacter hurinus TaxID=2201324 RepID=A0A367GLR3_9SPHI|nr:hypothetical protein [Mucilaginibacter hurinus]RCH53938.1 hypothetical protein DJ568_15475 [Mucilaginibacter hurinus]